MKLNAAGVFLNMKRFLESKEGSPLKMLKGGLYE
jgi:hypothetical protein